MQIINSITNQPKQKFNIKLDDNSQAIMRLYYYSSQNSWYFDIEYNNKQSNGNKVVLTLNAIRNFKRIWPFGIGFISKSNADPFNLDSFINGDVIFIVLNKEEVQMIEDTIYNESTK